MSLHFHRVYNKQNFKHFIKSKSGGAKWDLIASERVKGINQIDDDEDELELVSWMEPAHGDWRLSAEAEAAATRRGGRGQRRGRGPRPSGRPAAGGRPGALWAGDGSADRWRRSVGQGWRNGDAAGRLGFSDSSVSLLGGSDNIRSLVSSRMLRATGTWGMGSGQVGSVNVQMGRRVWSVGWLVGYFAFRAK